MRAWRGCHALIFFVAWLVHPPLCVRCCFVGALLALASGKAERRQVHPLESTLTSVQICEICGRTDIPTERTEHTEPLAEKGLPQMARIYTEHAAWGYNNG